MCRGFTSFPSRPRVATNKDAHKDGNKRQQPQQQQQPHRRRHQANTHAGTHHTDTRIDRYRSHRSHRSRLVRAPMGGTMGGTATHNGPHNDPTNGHRHDARMPNEEGHRLCEEVRTQTLNVVYTCTLRWAMLCSNIVSPYRLSALRF
jgi:hypothetical protein